MSNYRVLVNYDPERSVFVARAPELEHCSSEGATRAEALGKLEEEIEAQVRNAREQGSAPPPALDDADGAASGDLSAKVSKGLHRDLLFQARAEGVELSQLVGELLASALDARRGRRLVPQRSEGQQPRQNFGNRPPRDERGGGGRYHSIMEDRASFVEYVRGLESGAPPARGPRGPRGGDDPRRRGPGRGPQGGGAGGGGGGGRGGGGSGGGGGGGDAK